MNGTTRQLPRQELAHRNSGGIEVTLLWSAADNELTVQVIDHFADEGFEVAVDHDRANHAYRHPWAYAAEKGRANQTAPLPAALRPDNARQVTK